MLEEKHLNLCQRIKDAGGQPYIVGGYVRDMLLGRRPKDVDIVVVGGVNQAVANLLNGEGEPVGRDFPVYIVDDCEVAYARTERKTGQGYTGFECEIENVGLEEDLLRRDLTINAIAMNPFTGEIIDPFNGARDLERGLLKPVGPHFGEDPLRVLRAARFAAQLDMTMTDELYIATQGVAHELITLTGERVWMELIKALQSNHPSEFFDALDRLQVLDIVFPEIAALQGRIQPEKYHPEGDAYVHTLLVIDRARQLGADDEEMFAALCHDLGKAVTPDDNLPHHYDHEALGVPLVHEMCNRLKAPTSFRRTAAAAAKEHLNIHRFQDLRPVKKVRLLMRLGVVQNNLLAHRVGLVAQADAQGRGPTLIDKPYPQREALLHAADLIRSVKGTQFAHLKDGKKIAQKMERERMKVL